jgi:hypothetical protein
MLRLARYKPALLYALKIWLTSVLLAPPIWYYTFGVRDESFPFIAGTFSTYYEIITLFGILFLVPGFLFFSAAVIFIERRPWRRKYKRFATAGLAAGLSFLFSYSLDAGGDGWSFVVFAASYMVLQVAAVFVYRWPDRWHPGTGRPHPFGGSS